MKRPLGCACLLFILFIRLFYICFPPSMPDYAAWQGRKVYAYGRVSSVTLQEIQGETQIRYLINQVSLKEGNSADNITYTHDKIYCYIKDTGEEALPIGCRVWVSGTFEEYEAAQNPGQFDSKFYYHIQDIGASLKKAEIIRCDTGKNILLQSLYTFKTYFLQKLDNVFTPKYGGVMKTVLLGDKTDLDSEMKALFREGGILHILTISGMHISMLGMGSFRLMRKVRVPIKGAAVTGLLVVLFYGAMIGTQAATFRAICMFLLQMAALLLGRTYDRLTGLSVAAMLLLLEQPMYVFYSGFLLSFGAVLGITVLAPRIEALGTDRGAAVKRLLQTFSGSIGILAATFPIQAYFYYEYPVYSMLVNLLVLPFLPYIVGIGALLLALPSGLGILIQVPAMVCQLLLYGYETVCRCSMEPAGHCLVIGAPKVWQIAVYYVCLLLLLWQPFHKENVKKVFTLLWLVVMAGSMLLRIPSQGLKVQFLSVGQGDCAIIRYGSETYVVDCGSTSNLGTAEDILLPCLKYYGIAKVNGVFISHADADHMNGIIQWLTAYTHSHVQLERILLPALSEEALQEEFGELLALAEKAQIPITLLGAGDMLTIGEMQLKVLHPAKGFADIGDANGYSQVLLFSFHGKGVLMTGDIGAAQETELLKKLQEEPTDIVALKAAHHGSKYSNTDAFLQAVSPEHIILSYGVGNAYGHPHTEAVARMQSLGADLWYTGRQGAIMLSVDEPNVFLYTK